jgi:hypothetical protein
VSPGKHQANRLGSYIADHQQIMQAFLRRADFVLEENLEFEAQGDGTFTLKGTVQCVNGIYIEVEKTLVILGGSGMSAKVQTTAYKYNAAIGKLGNILRYDSPHPTHNREHHKHTYDVLAGDTEGEVTFLYTEEERPTLGEMIEEVRHWFYDHHDAVIRKALDLTLPAE